MDIAVGCLLRILMREFRLIKKTPFIHADEQGLSGFLVNVICVTQGDKHSYSHSAAEILSTLYSAALYYFYPVYRIYFTLYFRDKVI